jgi:hypothetical protein
MERAIAAWASATSAIANSAITCSVAGLMTRFTFSHG